MPETFKNNNRTDSTTTTFGFKTRTRIGTWNLQTLLEPSKLNQVVREAQNYKLQILGLSEVRWPGFGEHKTTAGMELLYSGKPECEKRESGVGFLLSSTAKQSLINWTPISDRIIIARFKGKARNVTILQCYAPTEVAKIEDKEAFYDELNNTFESIQHGDIKILLGDLNAKVGADNTNLESIMGKHGLGTRNENGELFTDFCLDNNLLIGGTIFPHKNIHKVTWVSPDMKTQNQIDHITISKTWRKSLLDVRSFRGADVASDHHLVIGVCRVKISKYKVSPSKAARKKLNLEKLKIPKTLQSFQNRIKNQLTDIAPPSNEATDKTWDHICEVILKTSEELLGTKRKGQKEWMSKETWELIDERKTVKGKLNDAKTRQAKRILMDTYSNLNKRVKRSAKSDKLNWINNLAKQAETAAHSHNIRQLYQITRTLSNKKFNCTQPLKDLNGKLITTDLQQLSRWEEHFTELLKNKPVTENIENEPSARSLRINTNTPSIGEIIAGINNLKSNKAAGPDNIPAEILKADSDSFAKLLHPLIKEIWDKETIPNKWKEGLIIKLPKKGDLTECENWRGITLLNVINKIVTCIKSSRVSDNVEPRLRAEQAGFRPNRSCVDHINTLRIIIEQSAEYQTPLYLTIVDFKRAFDSIAHVALWKILSQIGLPDKIINLIKELYSDATCRILHKGKVTNQIPVLSGVKQGCLLSPLLFNIAIDWVMRKTNSSDRGINWGLHKRLEDIDYADDICLLSHSHSDMQHKLDQLAIVSKYVGLEINTSKTMFMRIGTENTADLIIYNEPCKETDSFCYLGSIITKDGGAASDVANRINKARHAFASLQKVWNSTMFSRNTKIRLFNTNVKSVLLYACETWKTTVRIERRLQVFANRCLRRILRIKWSDRVSNEDLLLKSNQSKITTDIFTRKWNWIGHTLRRDGNSIAKQALDWNPQGKRKRGRPAITWRRSLLKELEPTGKSWSQVKLLARDKSKWKNFLKALCSN